MAQGSNAGARKIVCVRRHAFILVALWNNSTEIVCTTFLNRTQGPLMKKTSAFPLRDSHITLRNICQKPVLNGLQCGVW